MSEDKPSPVTVVHEAHDMLMEHVEKGSGKIRALALVTTVVTVLLAVSFLYQIVLPFQGVTSVTVNLADPVLLAIEAVEFVLVIAWLYVGVSDYRFTTKLAKQIREVRAAEAELMRKSGLES